MRTQHSLNMIQASGEDTPHVLAILTDAVFWLNSRGLPTIDPSTLDAVMIPAVARGEVYLAWLNGAAVGTITLQWADPLNWGERPNDAGYIHKLAVIRAAAGNQIGAHMVAWAEDQIIAAGRGYSRLDFPASNPAMHRFYGQLGYELRGEKVINGMTLSLGEKLLGSDRA